MADERRKAEFDVDSMKIVWAGSKHVFDVVDRMSKLVAADPVIFILLSKVLFVVLHSVSVIDECLVLLANVIILFMLSSLELLKNHSLMYDYALN